MDSKTCLEQINIFKGHFHFLHLMNVRCEVYLKQHYVNKLVTVTRDMLLKAASITINQTKPNHLMYIAYNMNLYIKGKCSDSMYCPLYTAGFIHFSVEQNQGLFKDFPGQKLQFSSTFFWAFSYIKPCLTFLFFKWKCLYPVRKIMPKTVSTPPFRSFHTWQK